MLQNDINYVRETIDVPVSEKIAGRALTRLVSLHESESVSAPYFLAESRPSVEEELPEGWRLLADEESKIEDGAARVVVYNAYSEACRTYDEADEDVELVASRLGGEIWVVEEINRGGDFADDILELESADGESPITILIETGDIAREFPVGDIDEAIAFLASLGK